MAMDYLPIQASSVPCERVFSSSAETDTKKRNRIISSTMEALQMLKSHLIKDRLNFTGGWVTTNDEMMAEDDPIRGPDNDPLTDLLEGNFQDSLDRVMRYSVEDDE